MNGGRRIRDGRFLAACAMIIVLTIVVVVVALAGCTGIWLILS